MRRLYILFLIHFLFVGKTTAQNSLDQQHEKFIRLHRTADPDKLLKMIQTEEKLLEKNNRQRSRSDLAKLALDRGIYFYMIDDYQKCISSFHKTEKLKGLKTRRDQILLFTYLGVSYRNGLEDYKKSNRYLDKAIELAEKEKDKDLHASAVIKKASGYFYEEKYREGVHLLEPFIQKNERYITSERKISIHGLLGQGYDKLGNYTKSYFHYTTCIELAKQTKNDELISDQYHNFIRYFLNKQRYREAKIPAIKAIRLLENKPGLEQKLHDSYSVLAQVYSSLNQSDSALYYAWLSHNYALKTNNLESLSVSYATLGHIYVDLGEYAKSLDFLLKSVEIEGNLITEGSSVDTYHNIGVVYLKMKNYRQAIVYFEKSNQQAYFEGDLYILQLNYGDLAKSHMGLGNAARAVVMQDSSFLYYDSLNNIENNRELLQQEVRYKTKLKEQENKLLKLEVKKQQETQRDMILLGVVVILLLLGTVYILFINNRLKKSKVAEADVKIRNQKLEEELLHQRLNLLTEEINRKNQLIQSLEDGANALTEENLLNKVTLENDWLAFMTEFDKIHGAYLSDLKQQFPELTTNNLRLAALVKLEFSNKEIANILCITENGVKKAKQRLKERIKME